MSEETQKGKMQRAGESAKQNAEPIGISAAVVASWAISTWGGVAVPAEVVASLGGVIGAFAARIKQ